MFFELIAAIVAGFLAAGVVLAINKVTGGILPKWTMPVAAGAAMIALGTYVETTWYTRTVDEFPDGVEVIASHNKASLFRPWTFVWPITNSLSAIDMASIRHNEGVPDQRMAQILFLGRWKTSQVVPMIFDCDDGLMAPMLDTVEFDASGAVTEAAWAPVGTDDPALSLVCREDMG